MPRYYNGGYEPLVPEGRWGEGVIMPGEPYDTDAELGAPWTCDAETDAALAAEPEPEPAPAPEPEAAPEPEPEAPVVAEHVEGTVQPNGDIVNADGQIVGHVDNNQEAS